MGLAKIIDTWVRKRKKEKETKDKANEEYARQIAENNTKNKEKESAEVINENTDRSVYSDAPNATQDDDMEEDLALLDDEDDLW